MIAKSISIKGTGCKFGGCVRKAVERRSGADRVKPERNLGAAQPPSAKGDANLRPSPAQVTEPPYSDPHVRWCGRGGALRLPPIPTYYWIWPPQQQRERSSSISRRISSKKWKKQPTNCRSTGVFSSVSRVKQFIKDLHRKSLEQQLIDGYVANASLSQQTSEEFSFVDSELI